MKNKSYSIAASLLLLTGSFAVSSCNKLDEHPSTIISEGQFYKTTADATAAVNAAYSTLNSDPLNDFPIYGRNLNLLIGNGSDDQVFSPSNTNPDVRALGTTSYIPANDRIRKNWVQHYYGISRANVAIDKISGMSIDTATRNNLVREAKFIRGLLYFNLVRLHGAVPLVLHDSESLDISTLRIARTSADSIYGQIISDLSDATNLPAAQTGANKGRATSGSAHALLAKVYVTRKEWSKALSELQLVITPGHVAATTAGKYGYDLYPSFRDAFQKATKNGIEHVFSVQFEGGLGAKNIQQFLSSTNFSSFNPAVYAGDIPDERLVAIFDDADTRKAVTFFNKLTNPSTGAVVDFGSTTRFAKFIDFSISPLTNQASSSINFPVIRYSDLLLLYAETINELNGPTAEAYSAINKVRRRAYGGNSAYDLTPGVSQSDFRDAVFTERRKEFVQEANRWFDLARNGQLLNALKKIPAKAANVTDKIWLYPIPQVERDLNPLLTQNPGWD